MNIYNLFLVLFLYLIIYLIMNCKHSLCFYLLMANYTGCLKKSGILSMMKASIVGPAGAIGCTVGTQKT